MKTWRKSSHSATETACVELACVVDGIALRDSKNQAGPVLVFGPDRLGSFLAWVKRV